jgi:hypothetical protein
MEGTAMEKLIKEGSEKLSNYGQFGRGTRSEPSGEKLGETTDATELISIGLGRLIVRLDYSDNGDTQAHFLTSEGEVMAIVGGELGTDALRTIFNHIER